MNEFIEGRQEFKQMMLGLHTDLLKCIETINEPNQKQSYAELNWYPGILKKILVVTGLEQSQEAEKVLSEKVTRDLTRD